MNEPFTISSRAANDVRSLVEQTQRLQDTLRTYVEALAAALDVPRDWRFDTHTMTFVPPATIPAEPAPVESTPTDGVEE